MRENKNLNDMSPEELIFSLRAATSHQVKKALKIGLGLKFLAGLYWAVTMMSVMSFMIAVTGPFDQSGLQANILRTYRADVIPKLQQDLVVSPQGDLSEGKHTSPGMVKVILGEVRAKAGDSEVEISGIKPCVKQIGDGQLSGNLRIVVDGKAYKKASVKIPAGEGKMIQIRGDVSGHAQPGDRLMAGICEPFEATINGEEVEIDNTFPIYDSPISIVGSRPIFIDRPKR